VTASINRCSRDSIGRLSREARMGRRLHDRDSVRDEAEALGAPLAVDLHAPARTAMVYNSK